MFSAPSKTNFKFLFTSNLSSANALNLVQSKKNYRLCNGDTAKCQIFWHDYNNDADKAPWLGQYPGVFFKTAVLKITHTKVKVYNITDLTLSHTQYHNFSVKSSYGKELVKHNQLQKVY